MKQLLFAGLLLLSGVGSLQAHETSRASIAITASKDATHSPAVSWNIALADLDILFDLDRNLDGNLTAAEFDAGRPSMRDLAATGLIFWRAGQACSPRDVLVEPGRSQWTAFGRLHFALECVGEPGTLELDYRLFQGLDANHRVLVGIGEQQWLVTPGVRAMLANPAAGGESSWRAFSGFVGEGVHHILIGWDHLAFLLTLMIPARAIFKLQDIITPQHIDKMAKIIFR